MTAEEVRNNPKDVRKATVKEMLGLFPWGPQGHMHLRSPKQMNSLHVNLLLVACNM